MEQREVNSAAIVAETLPGRGEATCLLNTEGHCITCSDEAVPARVVWVDQQTRLALVTMQNAEELEVDASLVEEEVAPGDWLLIHGGVALGLLDEPEAGEARHA